MSTKISNLERVAVVATLACILKLLMEGVTFKLFGSPVNLGHTDSMTYAALLAPLWGSHGYIYNKSSKETSTDATNSQD